jgi:predicted ATPase
MLRVKKAKILQYDLSSLDNAVKCVKAGEMSVRKAAEHFKVPNSSASSCVMKQLLLLTSVLVTKTILPMSFCLSSSMISTKIFAISSLLDMSINFVNKTYVLSVSKT